MHDFIVETLTKEFLWLFKGLLEVLSTLQTIGLIWNHLLKNVEWKNTENMNEEKRE